MQHISYIMKELNIQDLLYLTYILKIYSLANNLKKFFLFGSIFLQFVQIFRLMCFGEY